MKRFLVLALMVVLTGCAPAKTGAEAQVFATWGSFSGSLPPEYAWEYSAVLADDGTVAVTYCKGYADAAPGCATVNGKLAEADLAALQAALRPLAAAMAAHPPHETEDIPVGGGSSFGTIDLDGIHIDLPSFPVAADQAAVSQALSILRAATPQALIDKAMALARSP